MADESHWIERAQSAEAKLATCQQQIDRVKQTHRDMMETLGAKKRGDGTVDIDFAALADKLSVEHALELRAAIDERHGIRGEAGEKPRVTVKAETAA